MGLLVAIGIINVSVFCIWVPARLQISQTFIRINNIWDRIEKVIFAVIDMSLNVYFMRLVKSKLVASGLKQYDIVWKYNVFMVFISISLDILVIGLMSLPDDAVYVQVHPLTFLAKLNIEMNMVEMLGKVVKQSNKRNTSLPTPDIWQPYLGTDRGVFDREWVGSAKDSIMPPRGGAGGSGEGGSAGGGQRHELNIMDILNNPNLGANDSGASTSGTQDDGGKRGQSQQVEERGSRGGSVHKEGRIDSGKPGG
ncbi:hypothetical protein VTG60DRAFT_4252 [Thermothelomyces hinnuleus]